MKRFEIKILVIIFLFALAIRLTWAIRQPSDAAAIGALPDQAEYLSLGQNLLTHHTLFFYDGRFDQAVYAYRTPGYPIFIALCGGSPVVVRVVQSVVDAGDVLAVYLLAQYFLEPAYCLLAAMLIAFNPFLIFFSGLILSETLCTAMILWSVVLCVSARRWGFIFGPMLAAVSVMVRPSGLLLPIIIPAIARFKRKGAFAGAIIGVLSLAILLFVWADRNNATLHHWIWTTTNAGITQYDGFNPEATGASDQRFVQQMPELAQLDEVGRNDRLTTMAADYRRAHPGRVFSLAIAKLARTFSPIPLSDQFSRPVYLAIAAVYSIPVFLLGIIALISRRIGWRVKIVLLSVPVYFAVIHALSVGSLRYRIPAEPFLAVLAVAGLASFWNIGAKIQN